MKDVTAFVSEKGEKFHRAGKTLIQILLASLGLYVVILVVAVLGWGPKTAPYVFTANLLPAFGWVNALIILCYLGILVGQVGLPLYFFGIQYMGLGQIAKNLENQNRD